jgi:hypothetical protein
MDRLDSVCPHCGNTDRKTPRTAYGPDRQQVDCCDVCREALEEEMLKEWAEKLAEALCHSLNGGDSAALATAFFKAFTRQHRYLQGEFFTFLWKFFGNYRMADCDARNEHAVKTAGRWYDSFCGSAK